MLHGTNHSLKRARLTALRQFDLGRDNKELLTDFKIWIRDDGRCHPMWQMPDTDNDKI